MNDVTRTKEKKVAKPKCNHAWVLSSFCPPVCLWCGERKPKRQQRRSFR